MQCLNFVLSTVLKFVGFMVAKSDHSLYRGFFFFKALYSETENSYFVLHWLDVLQIHNIAWLKYHCAKALKCVICGLIPNLVFFSFCKSVMKFLEAN